MSADLLEAIVAGSRRSSDERARRIARADLERRLEGRTPMGARFRSSLKAGGVRVIAECKRRSPSRGILRADYDPAAIAEGYAAAGAAAISVLTEPTFFDGTIDDLRAVRSRVACPLLRKDFLVTDYQIVEAAAAGADAVLLIVAALTDPDLEALIGLSRSLGLAPLVEVHDRAELRRALDRGADIIGVNSRNLRTLQVSGLVLEDLAAVMPHGIVAVAESGLKTADDLRRLKALRYDAFLIGERFMVDADPGAALAALISDAGQVHA